MALCAALSSCVVQHSLVCVTCLFEYFYAYDSNPSEFDWPLFHSLLTSLDLY